MSNSRPTEKRRVAKEELLSGRVFFLDVNESNFEKLKKQIVQYGGDVSHSFDAKIVTHLITSKKPQGADNSIFTSNITSSLGSEEPNRAAVNKPKAIPAHISRSTDSPNKRVASMIQAVQANNTLIDIARKFNIKVIHLSSFVAWLNEQGTPAVMTPVNSVPFIAIEDLRGEVRSVKKEFSPDSTGQSTLPSLHLDAPRGAGIWAAPTNSDFRRAQSEANKVRRTSLGQQKSTALIEDSTDSYRPREGFCECCDAKFNDFLTHINSDLHKEMMENHEVMNEIDDVLRTVNTANGLLDA